MLTTLPRPPGQLVIVRRLAPQPVPDLHLRPVRPSLLDRRFAGDAWVVDQGDGTLAVRLGDYNLVQLTALALDLPSLNQTLGRVWQRRPGRRA
jgi:hypothetical protein